MSKYPAASKTPSKKITAEEIANFGAYLNHPDEPQRLQIVEMIRERELSLLQIAAETGVSLNTVKLIKARGVQVGMLDADEVKGRVKKASSKRAEEGAAPKPVEVGEVKGAPKPKPPFSPDALVQAVQDASKAVSSLAREVGGKTSASTTPAAPKSSPAPKPHAAALTPQEHAERLECARLEVMDLEALRRVNGELEAALGRAHARVEDLEADNASLEAALEDAAATVGALVPVSAASPVNSSERIAELEALLALERADADRWRKIASELPAEVERALYRQEVSYIAKMGELDARVKAKDASLNALRESMDNLIQFFDWTSKAIKVSGVEVTKVSRLEVIRAGIEELNAEVNRLKQERADVESGHAKAMLALQQRLDRSEGMAAGMIDAAQMAALGASTITVRQWDGMHVEGMEAQKIEQTPAQARAIPACDAARILANAVEDGMLLSEVIASIIATSDRDEARNALKRLLRAFKGLAG